MEKLYNYTVFSAAIIFFGYVSLRMVFPVLKSKVHPMKGFPAFLAFFLFFLILWALDRLLIRKMSRRTAEVSIILMISANIALQIFCLHYLEVKPTWDFGAIMNAADDISIGRAIRNWGYFQEYPYNINPAVIIGSFKYLLGGNQLAPYTLNIFCVTASIIGACLLAFRVYGRRAAVLAAAFFIGVTPLYLYIPIVYTDTLSMPFAIWTVYVWFRLKSGKKRILSCCILIGFLGALGFLIKQIAAVGLIAFVVDYIICRAGYRPVNFQAAPRPLEHRTGYQPEEYRARSLPVLCLAESLPVEPGVTPLPEESRSSIRPVKHRKASPAVGHHFVQYPMKLLYGVLPLTAALLTFFLVTSAFRLYVDYKGFDSRLDGSKSLPFTHWLMMGMNTPYSEGGTSSGYGGFSAEDLKYSRSYKTTSNMKSAEMAMINYRLQQYGITGYATFLLKKIEWTWTDGTYFAPVKLARYPVQRTILHKFVLFSSGKANKLYLAFTQLVQTIILSMILIGCILSLRKKPDRTFRLMTLMSLGLMFFLLFWETRSRYLTFMLPAFVVMAVYGMLHSFEKLDAALFHLLENRKKRNPAGSP